MWPFTRKKARAAPKASRPVAPVVKEAAQASRKADAAKVLDLLDAPELSVDGDSNAEGFNPYDTGVFDRGKLWENWRNQD
jgi:hypothetical protein